MKAARRQQIERLAETVREACRVDATPDIGTLRDVVKLLGGELKEIRDTDFEAKIEKTETAFRITLSKQFIETRRKFSIAHELGHLFLHMGYLLDDAMWQANHTYTDSVRYRFGRSEEEYEANEFAAAFLMPRDVFKRVASTHLHDGVYDVAAIAEALDVSVESALTRGRWLGLFPWE